MTAVRRTVVALLGAALVPLALPAAQAVASTHAPAAQAVTTAPAPADDVVRGGAASVRASASALGVTKVLVIPAHWGTGPGAATPAQIKKVVITDSHTWFRNASYGRAGLTGAVTPWVRVAPHRCGDLSVVARARAAAARLGVDLRSYQRTVVYAPCGPSSSASGVASLGGREVLLYGQRLPVSISVHEQGHNLGLEHGNLWQCLRGGVRVTYAAGSSCRSVEYGDEGSSMGSPPFSYGAPDYSAPHKAQLGWLTGRYATVTAAVRSRAVTLTPFSASTPGAKAVKVAGSGGRTYWAEYRTLAGNDRSLPSAHRGVVLHMTYSSSDLDPSDTRALLLDVIPDNGRAVVRPQPALPLRSSWTSPEGIRFTSVPAANGNVTVVVTRGVTATRPGRVTGLRAVAGDGTVDLAFFRAPDGGRAVQHYDVTITPGGRTFRVSDFGAGSAVRARIGGLSNGTTHSFVVTPHNELGAGTGVATTATPLALFPSVVLTSPTQGSSVQGVVTIAATAAPHPVSKRPIERVECYVDGQPLGAFSGASGTCTWDTGLLGSAPGTHVVSVRAVDVLGRTAVASASVTLTATSGPTTRITSPTNGQTVPGEVRIVGTATSSTDSPVDQVSVMVNGDEFVADLDQTPGPTRAFVLELGLVTFAPGQHTATARATDTYGRTGPPTTVTFVVTDTAPGVVIASPASGATVGDQLDLLLDVTQPGGPTTVGLYITATDASGFSYDLGFLTADVPSGTSAVPVPGLDTSFLEQGELLLTVEVTGELGRTGSATTRLVKLP